MDELSRKHGQRINLGTVPREEWDAIGDFGFNAVWLMGVWERSPVGIVVAREKQGLEPEFRRVLRRDYSPKDVAGSPYCIHRYVVDRELGGAEGLAAARAALAARNLRLVLDFVPNHVAPDHPWILEHPEYFIRGTLDELNRAPEAFFESQ